MVKRIKSFNVGLLYGLLNFVQLSACETSSSQPKIILFWKLLLILRLKERMDSSVNNAHVIQQISLVTPPSIINLNTLYTITVKESLQFHNRGIADTMTVILISNENRCSLYSEGERVVSKIVVFCFAKADVRSYIFKRNLKINPI